MQQQAKNEQLFQIEQELKKMLTAQQDMLGKTRDIDKQRTAEGRLPAPPFSR